ncbi:sulfite exporter TauE/SafE family protein [Halogeometricum sp. CBA1124]|uniref:sulfite exporter TauE/SafE family protein n=1 Tax=Halogeometricum sp. CBA1124 TaxID=2668071 RepID=UPI00142C0800|nr:sulfite exporter TauE/SafE family protein [Halogeometricum sp. CBA1124]MUV57914.1 TSUP family transporter [Halogeometricum sp. CBA1124]
MLGVELTPSSPTRVRALLGAFLVVAAALVWRQAAERREADDEDTQPASTEGRIGAVGGAAVGLFVGTAGGLLGVGGPVLAVPILVTGGVPMLAAVAAAQVQSVFVSGFAATGYFARGAVSLPLAVLVGVPELLGVLVGWRVAHRVPSARLKRVLATVLAVLGPYVALTA